MKGLRKWPKTNKTWVSCFLYYLIPTLYFNLEFAVKLWTGEVVTQFDHKAMVWNSFYIGYYLGSIQYQTQSRHRPIDL